MKKLILLIGCLMLLLPLTSNGSQITQLVKMGVSTPITKTIQHLQPRLSWNAANHHAWLIYEVAESTGVDWKNLVAITFQESSFKHFKGDRSCGLTSDGTEACVWKTFGPMHVYYAVWKKRLKLSSQRMLHDLKYGYQIGAAILLLQRTAHIDTDANWIGRYNSSTRKHKLAYASRVYKHRERIRILLDNLVAKAQKRKLQV